MMMAETMTAMMMVDLPSSCSVDQLNEPVHNCWWVAAAHLKETIVIIAIFEIVIVLQIIVFLHRVSIYSSSTMIAV